MVGYDVAVEGKASDMEGKTKKTQMEARGPRSLRPTSVTESPYFDNQPGSAGEA